MTKKPKPFMFVGEEKSSLARKMRVSWGDGRLAAKQLFDGLRACNIDPAIQTFRNWFDLRQRKDVLAVAKTGTTIIAMGKRVQAELSARGIEHIALIHPAARGAIRKKERYIAHVCQVMAEAHKEWHKPVVTDHGHVSKLTAGTVGTHLDKGHMANQHGQG